MSHNSRRGETFYDETTGWSIQRLWSFFTFNLVQPMVKTVYSKGILELSELARMNPTWGFRTSSRPFEKYIESFDNPSQISTWKCGWFFVKLYFLRLLLAFVLKLILIGSEIARLFVLNMILIYCETALSNNALSVESVSYIVGCCAILFICKVVKVFSADHNLFMAQAIGEFTKSSLSNAIYNKTLKLNSSSKQEYSTGTVMNIATTDTEKFEWFYYHVEIIIGAFVYISVSISFSMYLLGISALVGFSVILLVIIPISIILMVWEQRMEKIIEANQDERSEIISQLVSAMRFVKFYTMEKLFKDKIMTIRDTEMKNMKKGFISDAGMECLWNTFVPFISFVSFVHFCYFNNQTLTVSLAFSFLNALELVRYETIQLPSSALQVSRAITGFNRIVNLLRAEEVSQQVDQVVDDEIISEMKDATFSWDPIDSDEPVSCLKDINLTIRKGEFICVIGKVGSGKSSFLSSLLGETRLIPDEYSNFQKQSGLKYAYVSQDSWIRNQTIRENITFGEEFDLERYSKVLHACNLEPDLYQISKEISDLSMIGENGVNLSGGQQLRVSLARCLYSNADVYLLDDPLSAVDVHTADHIMKFGILPLLEEGKTTIMVTNQIHFIDKAKRILVLEDGRIIQNGTFDELYQDTNSVFRNLIDEFSKKKEEEEELFETEQEEEKPTLQLLPNDDESLEKYTSIDEEQRVKGTVWENYKTLFLFAVGENKPIFTIICGIGIIIKVLDVLHQYILTKWSSDETYANFTLLFYLLTYLGSALLYVCADMIANSLSLSHYLNTAKKLHEKLMNSIVNSCISFFDNTPVGRILARFTRDTNEIDIELNGLLRVLVPCVMFWVMGIVSILILSPYSIFGLLLVFPILLYYQSYFRVTLRELSTLSGIYSSPLSSQISETLNGLQTIRAFGKEEFMKDLFESKADQHVLVRYNLQCMYKYFDIRFEIFGGLAVSFIILSSVLAFSGPLVGMIILQATSNFDILFYISYLLVMIENGLVSIQRIHQYSNLESEKYEPAEICENIEKFASEGEIQFKNVLMRYKTLDSNNQESKLVLKGINFSIKAKERIAICGRTGCGKSSLIQSLFRMQEVEPESSILVDGTDIRNVPLETLRSAMCIIPQQPTLFKGTLRDNLDGYSQFSDRELWSALEKVGMKDKLYQLSNENETENESDEILPRATGLDMEISENGENISAGTRQLLCLARALIRKCKILVLDEATALCDLETDKLIQQVLRNEFSQKCTVICVAHRLETILDYDKVVVIDDGNVKEFASPTELLSDTSSMFYAMIQKHNKIKLGSSFQ